MSNIIFLEILPEIFFFFIIVLYIINFFVERNLYFLLFFYFQSLFLLISIYINNSGLIFLNYWFSNNNFLLFFKVVMLFCLVFFIMLLFTFNIFNYNKVFLYNENLVQGFFEYSLVCLLFVFSGFFFFLSNDFLLIYIFLEIQSMCLYLLASYNYESSRASEAGLKYFIFGVLFSGFFLFGWLLIYAALDLSNMYSIKDILLVFLTVLYNSNVSLLEIYNYDIIYTLNIVALGCIFLVLSVVGKLGLFPFHNWIVDVYDGVSYVTLFFFSVFPKVFLLIFLIRFSYFFSPLVFFGYFSVYWVYLFWFCSLGSMLVGAVSNFSQWRLKRFLVFSSIVNMGYILLFFSFFFFNFGDFLIGVSLNLIIYVITLLIFFYLIFFYNYNNAIRFTGDVNELFSLRNNNDVIGLFLVFLMLSLAGVPPFFGFYGKFFLLYYLWCFNYYIFGVVLLVSLLSAFYYIRLGRSFFVLSNVYTLLVFNKSFISYLLYLFILFQFLFLVFFINYFGLFGNYLLGNFSF